MGLNLRRNKISVSSDNSSSVANSKAALSSSAIDSSTTALLTPLSHILLLAVSGWLSAVSVGDSSFVFDVAVIGAGISGISCAQQLRQVGYRVVVVEKSRGLGGRMATRRVQDTW